MPAWSTEIANDFIRLAAVEGRALDQMQLQELVYIAHGWCLATTGEPLTGDRPEALEHGPEYRRLASALARYGLEPVTREITLDEAYPGLAHNCSREPSRSDLDPMERDVVVRIFKDYGRLEASKLATLTRCPGTPWADVYADGTGKSRDIPHELIRGQFVDFAAKLAK